MILHNKKWKKDKLSKNGSKIHLKSASDCSFEVEQVQQVFNTIQEKEGTSGIRVELKDSRVVEICSQNKADVDKLAQMLSPQDAKKEVQPSPEDKEEEEVEETKNGESESDLAEQLSQYRSQVEALQQENLELKEAKDQQRSAILQKLSDIKETFQEKEDAFYEQKVKYEALLEENKSLKQLLEEKEIEIAEIKKQGENIESEKSEEKPVEPLEPAEETLEEVGEEIKEEKVKEEEKSVEERKNDSKLPSESHGIDGMSFHELDEILEEISTEKKPSESNEPKSNGEAEREVEELKKKLSSKEQDMSTLLKEKRDLQSKLVSLQRTSKEEKVDSNENSKEMDILKQEIIGKDKKISELSQSVTMLQKEVSELIEKNNSSQKKISGLEDCNARLTSKLEAVRKIQEEFKSIHVTLTQFREEKQHYIHELEVQISKLKEEDK